MDNGYQGDLTLDRIKVDKGYTPVNCRWVTWSIQGHNKRPYSASGFKGVYANKARWCAKISVKSKMVHLGTFDTPLEAAKVYNEAALELYGDLAKLNPIEEE
jgi:hypothetical protein